MNISLLILQTANEIANKTLKDYLHLFFDINNPIFIVLLTAFLIVIVVYVFLKNFIFPMVREHEREKSELELKSARLTALFAELDPDPVLRVDMEGKVIDCNNKADELFDRELENKRFSELIPDLVQEPSKSIAENEVLEKIQKFGEKHFRIIFKGFAELGIAQVYFSDITSNISYQKELKRSRQQYRELSDHLQDTLEEERSRIARELHDSVGQKLTSLKLEIQNRAVNSEFSSRFDEISSELRDIAFSLKPKLLEERGLVEALMTFVSKISESTGLKGECFAQGFKERLDTLLELCLFRVAQESLQNIIKHSFATEFFIHLNRKNAFVLMTISDNGKGFEYSPEAGGGMGLFNMKERISKFNGKFKIDSPAEGGAIVIAEIPLKNVGTD